MEWLSSLLGTGISAASGGVMGMVGGLGSSVMKYFSAKQEFQQKKEMLELQHGREKEMLELQSKITVTEESWKALTASHEVDAAVPSRWAWVDAVRTLYRPFLTTGLFVMVYLLFLDILAGLSGAGGTMSDIFTGNELKELISYIVYSIVFAAATAGMWWFSERAFTPPGAKNR